VRDGRFGAYVNWGRVNATIPKSIALDAITLQDAIELIAEREGKPAKPARKPAAAKAKAPEKAKPAAAKKAPAKDKPVAGKPAPPAKRKA
jgi:DNA topoisomerase I